MVLLVLSDATQAVLADYLEVNPDTDSLKTLLSSIGAGRPIEHVELVKLSRALANTPDAAHYDARTWRLDTLLKGARIYSPPAPSKAEPVGCPCPVLYRCTRLISAT